MNKVNLRLQLSQLITRGYEKEKITNNYTTESWRYYIGFCLHLYFSESLWLISSWLENK